MGSKNKLIVVLVVLVLAISVPLTMFLLQQRQDPRSKAAASTTLSFTPTSPVTASPNSDIYLDIMIEPGTNAVSYIRYHVTYDPNVMQLADVPFVANTAAFPVNLEGPFITNGSIIQSLSIGNDPTKVVTKPTKVGTLHFKAIKSTNNEVSKVVYGDKTLILSSGENDQANENVLSTTTPADVIIADASPSATVTITETPSPTVITTETPTPTISLALSPTTEVVASPTSELTVAPTTLPTALPTSSPTSSIIAAQLNLNVLFHGIGNAGDNVNPTGSDFSNKNPVHSTRTITLSFYNELNILSNTVTAEIKYSSESGSFLGTVGLPSLIANGVYTIKVKGNQHLVRRVPGIFTIQSGQTLALPSLMMITGDADNDNKLSILDYNILVDCYSDLLAAAACSAEKKVQADLNDDDKVNAIDYNLFLRELGSQKGD